MHEEFKEKLSKLTMNRYWENLLTPDEKTLMKDLTIFLPEHFSLKSRRIYILNGITQLNKCLNCGSDVFFDEKHNINGIYCSKECYREHSKAGSTLHKEKQKYKATIETKEKRKATNLERYGVENPFQDPINKEKSKNNSIKTNIEKYGVEHYSQTEEFKRFLSENNPMYKEENKLKLKETNLKIYNTENPMQNDDVKNKAKETCFEKYGSDNFFKTDAFKDLQQDKNRNDYYDTFIIQLKLKYIQPEFSKDEYVNMDYNHTVKKYKCLVCDKEFESTQLKVQKIYCPHHVFKSKYETDIKDWILSIKPDLEIIMNKKFNINSKAYELDIFIPELKLGVEYHGLFWHSDVNKDVNYHKDKYTFFKQNNINIIQIFETEWRDKPDIVKSIISSRLGIFDAKIPARKCIVRELTDHEYKTFCMENHIQGYCVAKVRLGLIFNNEIVQIMSFSKPRYGLELYDWENIRTCTKKGTIVIGGFSKLLSNFRTNHKGTIVSYIDVRYFTGRSYMTGGFDFLHHTEPNFFYFKNTRDTVLESRMKFQKHKLKDLLDNYNENDTAELNMLNNGYLRIFDAGNLVLLYS